MTAGSDNEQLIEMREAGKQFATVAGLFQVIYFATISISDIEKNLNGLAALPYFGPLVLWLVTLTFSLLLMFPNPPVKRYEDISKHRAYWLQRRQVFWWVTVGTFFAGLVWMTVVLIIHWFFV